MSDSMAEKGAAGAVASLSLTELHDWLVYQLDGWNDWASTAGEDWLRLPSGNPSFPDVNALLLHAFLPLHRYADQALGQPPLPYPAAPEASWAVVEDWARRCLARYAQACAICASLPADEIVEFKTRSSGVLRVSRVVAMTQAATHCFWHLGGVAHLLRAAGIEPPQKSDLLFWAAAS